MKKSPEKKGLNQDLKIKFRKKKQKKKTEEKKFYSTKQTEEIKDRKEETEKQHEEDQKIINDENAFPEDKEYAEERIAQRIEELADLQTLIQEREETMPLREKIKEIFKKTWCYRDCHISGRGCHNRSGYWHNDQRFEKTRNRFGKWS